MNVISNNIIQLKDGTKVDLPKSGHMKLCVTSNENRKTGVINERVFCNGKEFKDGEFKVTFAAIFNYLFG